MSLKSTSFIMRAWDSLRGKEETVLTTHGALKSIDEDHYHLHHGELFSHHNKYTLPQSGGYVDILLTPNSGTQLKFQEWGISTEGGPVDAFLYQGPFTDANSIGTDISSELVNQDRTYTDSIGCSLYRDPFIDVNSIGQRLDFILQPVAAGGASKGGGGGKGSSHEWTLAQNVSYLIRIASRDVSSVFADHGYSVVVNSSA